MNSNTRSRANSSSTTSSSTNTRSSNSNSRIDAMPESKLNLLVRYLDHAVDDDQLRRFFLQFGDVTSSMVMRDIFTGENRGFGFVRFAQHCDAARALAEADGKKIGAKAVNVIWAKQQHDMAPAGQERLKMTKLFLRNVPVDVTEAQLVALVSPCGPVAEVSLHNDKITAACCTPSRRIAFIVFNTEGAADAALHRVHNTCPFPSCCGIPLMAKLSEDYKTKPALPQPQPRVSPLSCNEVASAAHPPHPPLRRLSSEVITVPTIFKLAEQSCVVSTPNSATARSPGVSSLVLSLESTSLDPSGGPQLRQLPSSELEGSLHSSQTSLRTPVRRFSTDSTVYRHNPYGSTSIVPAALLSNSGSVVSESLPTRRASLLV